MGTKVKFIRIMVVVVVVMVLGYQSVKSRRSLSTGTQFSLQKVNFESASKVVPNDCNDMFWCISITNNVKSCKKFNEKAQTGKITVFTMVNQHCGAENMEKKTTSEMYVASLTLLILDFRISTF